MAITRRNFFKVIAGGLGSIALSVIIPFRPVLADDVLCSNPSPGKRELLRDEWLCRDYMTRPTIQEYVPGEPIKVQDLSQDEQDCSKCQYEEGCTCSGERWRKREQEKGKITSRTFYPELWNKKFKLQFYNDSVLGNL